MNNIIVELSLSLTKMQSAMSFGGGMPTVMIVIKDNND